MEVDKFVNKKDALKMLGISHMTLIKLMECNKIEYIKTIGGQRRYNVAKFIRDNKIKTDKEENEKINETKEGKVNICYVRVSTSGQKDDLERQKEYMKKRYPNYILIEDIGSGINFNRKGLRKIIKMAISGKINKVVIAFRDRLTRFGFELIEDLVKEYSNGEIIVENKKEEVEPKEEIVDDVLQILNVYTAKMNGLRKYHNKN